MTTQANQSFVVTPALGPVPAIYVPSGNAPSLWHAVAQLLRHHPKAATRPR